MTPPDHPPLTPSEALHVARAVLLAAAGDDAGDPRAGGDWEVVRLAADVLGHLGEAVGESVARPPRRTR